MARDSNGTKPIYYGNISGKFCFSSEIKSLLAIGLKERFVKRHLNIITNKDTIQVILHLFQGIKKFVMSEVLSYDVKDQGRKFSYNLNEKKKELNEKPENIEENIRHLINKSVKQTLMGRRKVGLFLSGGMDSSSILYEMMQLENLIPLLQTLQQH